MDDQELRALVNEMRMGAVALGLCIARTLGKSHPNRLFELASSAQDLGNRFGAQGKADAAQLLISFALALTHPERFPLFSTSDGEATQ